MSVRLSSSVLLNRCECARAHAPVIVRRTTLNTSQHRRSSMQFISSYTYYTLCVRYSKRTYMLHISNQNQVIRIFVFRFLLTIHFSISSFQFNAWWISTFHVLNECECLAIDARPTGQHRNAFICLNVFTLIVWSSRQGKNI